MTRQNTNSSWPLLCILACLFIVSAVAPWSPAERSSRSAVVDTLGPDAYAARLRSNLGPRHRESVVPLAVQTAAPQPVLLVPQAKITAAYQEPATLPVAIPRLDLATGATLQLAGATRLPSFTPQVARDDRDLLELVDASAIETLVEAVKTPTSPQLIAAQPKVEQNRDVVDETALHYDLPEIDEPVMVEPVFEISVAVVAAPVKVAAPVVAAAPAAVPMGDWVARAQPLDHAVEQPAVAVKIEPALRFPQPVILMQRLDDLASECDTGLWAMTVRQVVGRLLIALGNQSDEAATLVQQLTELSAWSETLAQRLDDDLLARRVRQAAYALDRRITLWQSTFGVIDAQDACPLMEAVERFEQTGLVSDGRTLAAQWDALQRSPVAEQRTLGTWLEEEYRNANFRAVISETLLNRMVPDPQAEYGQVNDRILGLPVQGRSVTSSRLAIRLVPNTQRMRVSFHVNGQIAASTASDAGVATFYNRSQSAFYAVKELDADASGIQLYPARVSVRNRTQLRGVETSLDPIPIVGWVAQNVARSQHELMAPWAAAEAEERISARTRERIDDEVYAKLNNSVGELRERLFVPLERMQIRPDTISAETSPQRMSMRLRLASADQASGYTPRPRAPGDSLSSFQIHESAINNVLAQLHLDGQTMTLPELSKYVSQKLNRADAWAVDPEHEDVSVTFAPQNAIAVRCRDGQLLLTLSIARLAKGARSWKDFQVRVAYRPEVRGRSAELVRDGVVQLISTRLNNAGQIAVRGIFSRAFSKSHRWNLTPGTFVEAPQLADLAITQFDIDDGWMGIALGPRFDVAQTEANRK